MGTPRRVRDLLNAVRDQAPEPVLLHFHNTRGTALANMLTALELGVTEFDASVGGLGGCPYAPGATGNLATEEAVHMLHDMGIDTGIDLDALIEAAELAQGSSAKLPSGVLRAGPRTRLRIGALWPILRSGSAGMVAGCRRRPLRRPGIHETMRTVGRAGQLSAVAPERFGLSGRASERSRFRRRRDG